jgi:hypothetical protein
VALVGRGGQKIKDGSRSGGAERPASQGSAAYSLTADNVVFQEFFGTELPTSSSAGPRETPDSRALGFSHSEAGAVLAAVHIASRSQNAVGPAVFEPTIKEQVVGEDRDKLLSVTQQAYTEAAATSSTGPHGEITSAFEKARQQRSGVWAYRVDSYTESLAVVNLLLRTVPSGTAAYVNLPLTVRWVDGDWRLVAPVNGELGAGSQQLNDVPAGYVVIGKA